MLFKTLLEGLNNELKFKIKGNKFLFPNIFPCLSTGDLGFEKKKKTKNLVKFYNDLYPKLSLFILDLNYHK